MNTHLIASIAALLAYTAFSLYVGLKVGYTKKEVATHRDYFLGRGVGFIVLLFTTAATAYSAWIFMGAPGAFYNRGIGFATGITWQLVGMFVMGVWSPKFWRLSKDRGYTTPADLVQDYYNPSGKGMRMSVSISQLAFCIPTMIAQVSGAGLAIAVLTGDIIPMWAGSLYTVVVVSIYVYFGGFKSQAWVDTFQGSMFTIALWGAVIIMLVQPELGGIPGLFSRIEALNEKFLLYWGTNDAVNSVVWNWRNYLGFFVIQSIGITLAPYVWQRAYAAKSGGHIRKMAGVLGIIYTFGVMLPVMLAGFGGRALNVQPENADSIIVSVLSQYAPMWGIFIVVGIIACAMSTISSISVTVSSLVTVDIIKTFKPNLDTTQLRNIARWCVLSLIVVSMIAAFMGTTGIVVLINTAMAGFAQMFWPVFGIFVWKRATKEGALAGYLAGVITAAILTGTGQNLWGFIPGFWGFVLNGTLLFVVSLMTKPIDRAHRRQYMEPLVKNATKGITSSIDS